MSTIRKNPYYLIPALLIAAALLAYIGYFMVYNMYALALFRFPFDYDQGEGFELVDTILFSQGKWPYRDNNVYPFYSSNYPPVFHLVIMPLVWVFGPKYWTGRLVSYLGTLVTSLAIGYAVQRQVKRWWLAVIAALAYLASNYIYHVGPLFRQHLFMVMFETLAVVALTVIYEREEKSGQRHNKSLAFVMVLLLLAGYTKQLAYATVITVFVFMFLRDWKRAIIWAIPFGAVTGLIFLFLNVATGGQWYLATVTANINEFMPGQAQGLFKQWFNLHFILAVSAGVYVLYQLYLERLSVYSIWFIIATANCVTAGKWGAGESYFATAIAASCILMGLGFGRMLNRTQENKWAYPALLTLIPLLLLNQADRVFHLPTHTPFLRGVAEFFDKPTFAYINPQTSCSSLQPAQIIPYVDTVGPTLLGRPPTADDRAAGLQLVELMGQLPAPSLSEETAFNLWLGRDIITNPTQMLNIYKNDALDLSNILSMVENQEFGSILFRAQLYPPPLLHAVGQNYHVTHKVQMNGFIYCLLERN